MLPLVSKEKKREEIGILCDELILFFPEGLKLLVLEVDLPQQLVLLVAELGGDGRMGLPSSSACRMRRFFSNSARSVPSKAARPGPRRGVDEGLTGRGRTGATCARGRRRGNAEARGGEVDEGAPAAGARSTRGRRGPGRSADCGAVLSTSGRPAAGAPA